MQRPIWLFCLLLLWTGHALAWRCNGSLVTEGQTMFEVGNRCGDPQNSMQRTEWRTVQQIQQHCETRMQPIPMPSYSTNGPGPRGGGQPNVVMQPQSVCYPVPFTVTIPVEVVEWYYEFEDDGYVPKSLHFENGRLTFIESLWRLRQRH